jgi:hypothetical protein
VNLRRAEQSGKWFKMTIEGLCARSDLLHMPVLHAPQPLERCDYCGFPADPEPPHVIRAWARQHGLPVARQGRIPTPLLEAYRAAMTAPAAG